MKDMEFCPICSSNLDKEKILEYLTSQKEKDTFFSNRKIQLCNECGFGFVEAGIPQSELDQFYKTTYRKHNELVENTISASFNSFSYSTRAISQLLLAKAFRTFHKGENFLDIGAGIGMPFHIAKMLAMEMNFFAIEPDDCCYSFLKNLDAEIYPFSFGKDTIKHFGGEKFHLIVMSHILEHFNGEDVIAILKNVRFLLADDAIFLCEVPLCNLVKYAKYRHSDTPHLSFFSKDSLRKALEGSGFNVEFINCAGRDIIDCWKQTQTGLSEQITENKMDNFKAKFKNYVSKLPNSIKTSTKYIANKVNFPSIYKLLSDKDFQYGDNRECIRAIATKNFEV